MGKDSEITLTVTEVGVKELKLDAWVAQKQV
jgi:hypothetical protein